ncbi:SDH2C / succinate dehydrogenase subunit 2C [Leishmania donovani]|uniref:4Fe-4S dicluster domain family protein n=1 Tax=Leishmania donovani TaxID=5661 RepID=A0A504XX43_LEIDO|nr:4Fe-4S dicluster domain family protein [Leishmania donovani]CAJ1987529.1 SDH2C / succinate dehydrogenase subunit 2C [Leishmania donovani]VDZ43418.1 succinate_dehydrogenase_putative/GeneDB:LmjF.15.0990 [Leishmania donovani]
MPSAPLPGQLANYSSPLYMYRHLIKNSTAKTPQLYTAKDNSKTAMHLLTRRAANANYTVNRWYLKEKVDSSNRMRLEGLYECVLCASCTGSCPQYWWNREHFLGPAVLLQSYRWLVEPLDRDFDERVRMFETGNLVNMCHNIFNCSITCPKFLNPGLASKEIKRLSSPSAKRVGPAIEMEPVTSEKEAGKRSLAQMQ